MYTHGSRIDEIVWSQNTFTGEQAYHHYDARGHCTLLTDSVGNILEQYEYDAFGWPYFYDANGNSIGAYDPVQNLWEGYSQFGNRFLFTGREWIADLKLYDYRNRLYQPELGRFLQPDPKQFAAGDYNLYRYCHNDPVNKADPTGFWDINLLAADDPGHDAGDRTARESYVTSVGTWSGRPLILSYGTFTVGGHGDGPSSMSDSNRNPISAEKLAAMILANPNYDPHMKVRLDVCCVGDFEHAKGDTFGQKLANALGRPVLAPTGNVVLSRDGKTWTRWGYYKEFRPRNKNDH